jgi:uncharacterized membrane-anchored protein YhcB (DUF1043 family)
MGNDFDVMKKVFKTRYKCWRGACYFLTTVAIALAYVSQSCLQSIAHWCWPMAALILAAIMGVLLTVVALPQLAQTAVLYRDANDSANRVKRLKSDLKFLACFDASASGELYETLRIDEQQLELNRRHDLIKAEAERFRKHDKSNQPQQHPPPQQEQQQQQQQQQSRADIASL